MNFISKKNVLYLLFIGGLSTPLFAALPPYFSPHTLPLSESTLLATTPQANPAYFTVQDEMGWSVGLSQSGRTSWYTATPWFGSGIFTRGDSTHYTLHTGWQHKNIREGMGLSWDAGSGATQGLAAQYGWLNRLNDKTSLGATLVGELGNSGGVQGALDLGFRPTGTDLLTLGGTFVLDNARRHQWSVQATTIPIPGVGVGCRYTQDNSFFLGVEIQFGERSIAHHSGPEATTFVHFHSEPRENVLDRFASTTDTTFMELHLGDEIRYQRYRYFDTSQTLYGILATIQEARKNPKVKGLIINASEFESNVEFTWEIRNALSQFKKSGKHIVVFIEGVDTYGYYLASVADWIVLDPVGTIEIAGGGVTRSYWKGLLDKVGIGVDELRFFKYKTAYQGFSQDHMSEADKEQLTALAQNQYNLIVNAVAEDRKVSVDRVASWNSHYLFTSTQALNAHLVDQLGRWKDAKAHLASFNASVVPASTEILETPKDTYWGDYPTIAIIYAEGVCDMDHGIAARKLIKTLEAAIQNPKIEAIVFRIDSPGGGLLPSDIIAQAIKNGKTKKPIIISQGEYAASGGYWISAYGTRIVSAPNTKTGSIGVISLRFYNKEFQTHVGVTTDGVYVGEHADLKVSLRIPILNFHVPKRGYTPEERSIHEALIRAYYQDFVTFVADARHKTPEQIEAIAQGRIWAGQDALTQGLVDQLGGLDIAIEVAKKEAKIGPNQKINIIQLPAKGLFNWQTLIRNWAGLPDIDSDLETLKFYEKNNGTVLPMM